MLMNLIFFRLLVFIFFFFLCELVEGAVVLSSKDSVPQARWSLDGSGPKKEPAKTLYEVKKAAAAKKWASCIKLSNDAAIKAKSLLPWILSQQFECLKDPKSDGTALDAALRLGEKNSEWLLVGPYSSKLKTQMVEAYLLRLEQLSKADQNLADRLLDQAVARQDWMDGAQKARLFRSAGELAFIRQRLRAAESYFRRSLSEKESSDVRERIRSVLSLLKEKPREENSTTPIEPGNFDATSKERELSDRMSVALKEGDLVSAVEDGIEIITEYPGSQRARWATDRVYDAYSSIAVKTDPQYVSLKKRILKEMEAVDGVRLQGWMEKAFRQSFFEDVVQLSSPSIRKLAGTPMSTKVLSLSAHAYTFTGDDDRARSLFQEILSRHSGSDESVRALFRLGLMDFKRKDYISATANFERLLVYPDSDKFELQAKYWLWRSLQQIDGNKAKKIGQEISEKFPLTYYGLRAQAEIGKGKINLPLKDVNISEDLYFTSTEEVGWKRLKLLVEAGWTSEAQEELKNLSEPATVEARLLMARYWAAAFDYPTAMRWVSKCWDENPDLMGQPFIKIAFPSEFKSLIEDNAKKYGLDPDLVRGLIRQESSFSPVAVSPAGAKGLMQLMPAAADDMATDLGLKKKNPDIFEPATNVLLGAKYLQRVIKRFEGNISLALAAYNVGPEKLSRWMKSKSLLPQPTSDPSYELWIDEMPWSETSFYVKAILRNLIIYRALDKGRVQLGNPVWVAEAG